MAQTKNYSIAGIGPDVQYGKGGGRLVWATDHFEATTNGTTLSQLRVPTTPINTNDAASKIYVDSVASGVDAKNSVRAATTINGTIGTAYANGSTIDGVLLATNDRILIKDQTNAVENGIYVVQVSGIPVRATDADAAGELSGGTFVFIEEGTLYGDTGFVLTTNGSLTPGVDANAWVQFSSAGVISVTTGLTKTGNIVSVNIGALTISVNGTDDLIVNSSATVGQVLVSAGAIGTEATWGQLDLTTIGGTIGALRQDRGGLGSNVSGFAVNSMYVVGAANTTTALPIGVNGNTLRVVAGVPAWGQLNLIDDVNAVTGTLKATNGGTGNAAYVVGDILIGSGLNTLGKIAISATPSQVLTTNGTTAAWATPTPAPGTIVTLTAPVVFGGGITQLIGSVPAGARVVKVSVDITTVWSAVTTLQVGDIGNTARLMAVVENDTAGVANYVTDTNNVYAGVTVLNATLTAGGATAGAGEVIVQYIQP